MSQSYIYNTNNISKKNNFSNSMNSKLIDTYDKSNIKIPELLIKYFKNKNLKYNLKQRIFYYNHILERLKNISNNQCLVEYDINSKKSNNNKGYSINDTIFLTKKFLDLRSSAACQIKYLLLAFCKTKLKFLN